MTVRFLPPFLLPPDLDVVSLPGLLSEQEDGEAGQEAGQDSVEHARLAEVLSVPEVETKSTAGST